MEIESIRERLARAADTGRSNQHICVRAARPSGRARRGAGAGFEARKYQSLHMNIVLVSTERSHETWEQRERVREREEGGASAGCSAITFSL